MTPETDAKWIHREKKIATISITIRPFVGRAAMTKHVGQCKCVADTVTNGKCASILLSQYYILFRNGLFYKMTSQFWYRKYISKLAVLVF